VSYVVREAAGTITVTPAALTQLVVHAAEAVEGAPARVRRGRRHLEIEIEDGRAHVELELSARYGAILPEVARGVQERVADALATMCGVDVTAVDVSVEEVE
jgi:uncharacterized alkaline shock family protein YloU